MIINLPSLTRIGRIQWEKPVLLISLLLAIGGTMWALNQDVIVSYGDAESHLNIAKRVVHSLTPGMAQLGGIWLPLPHVLMVPLVYFDSLWRSGLAGSIVSGISYVFTALYIYHLTLLVTRHKPAAFTAALIFATNPNVIYMQATPMTEMPLIAFFVISSYYFIKYLSDQGNVMALVGAAFFGFCATLTRYDGWFLVGVEALVIILVHLSKDRKIPISEKGEGHLLLFATLAFFGILLWLAWDWLILGDPMYFTTSQFSAKSQQMGWLARGELPAYRNLGLAFGYYMVTAMSNIGVLVTGISLTGLVGYLTQKSEKRRWLITLVLMIPFIFYVVTLFMGQSVIFTPHLTPITFEWTLFNVRYGLMMVPVAAVFTGYVFAKAKPKAKVLVVILTIIQLGLYLTGYSKVITYEDGTVGLSASRRPDAEKWLSQNYDYGLVLMDDFARTVSIVRSGVPMQNMIYVGNKPYWEESLVTPQKHARWVILQKGDTVWNAFYETRERQDYLYSYYRKVYTSDEILIFQRINN